MPIPNSSKELNAQINQRMSVANKRYETLIKGFEKNVESAYLDALKTIRMQLKDIYAKLGDSLTNDVRQNVNLLGKYKRLDSLKQQIEQELYNLTGVKPIIDKSIQSSVIQGYYTSNWAVESSTGLDFNLPILNKEAIKASLLNPVDAIKWADRLKKNLADTIQQTQNAITQGIIQGKGYQETARNLKNALDISYNKSIRIIRTESHRAQVEGRNTSVENILPKAKRLGLEPKKILRAVRDNRTRPQSAYMDGKEAGEDGLFEYPEGVRGLPGQTGRPEWDINDRESIVTEFSNWSPEIREKRKGLQEQYGSNFTEWAKKKGLSKNIYGQKYLL